MQESLDAFRLDMTRAYTTPAPMPMPMPCCVWAGRRLRRMAHPYVQFAVERLVGPLPVTLGSDSGSGYFLCHPLHMGWDWVAWSVGHAEHFAMRDRDFCSAPSSHVLVGGFGLVWGGSGPDAMACPL
eukprot:365747-Chlamydomonas_euryale.AAC.53